MKCNLNDFVLAVSLNPPADPLADRDGFICNWPEYCDRETLEIICTRITRAHRNDCAGFDLSGFFAELPASGRPADAEFPPEAFAKAMACDRPFDVWTSSEQVLKSRWLNPIAKRAISRAAFGMAMMLSAFLAALLWAGQVPASLIMLVCLSLGFGAFMSIRGADGNVGKGVPYQPKASFEDIRAAVDAMPIREFSLMMSGALRDKPYPDASVYPPSRPLTLLEFLTGVFGRRGWVCGRGGLFDDEKIADLNLIRIQNRLLAAIMPAVRGGVRGFTLGGAFTPTRDIKKAAFPPEAYFAVLDSFEINPPKPVAVSLQSLPYSLRPGNMFFWPVLGCSLLVALAIFGLFQAFDAEPGKGLMFVSLIPMAIVLTGGLLVEFSDRDIDVGNMNFELSHCVYRAATEYPNPWRFTSTVRGRLRRVFLVQFFREAYDRVAENYAG